jgi:serine/threonine-protein kinase
MASRPPGSDPPENDPGAEQPRSGTQPSPEPRSGTTQPSLDPPRSGGTQPSRELPATLPIARAARARPTAVTVGDAPAADAPHVTPKPERYEHVRLLGTGGFGEVRLVRDRELGRHVAMKILRPEVARSPESRARFLAEIQLTAGLSHPGIVAVHDAGELPDGQLWYTMPEVRGRTFRAVIDAAFRAPPEVTRRRLLDLFARACEAIAYAHGKGVVHRDIKPENIMIGEHGEVLVMDWGIARTAGAPESAQRPGTLGGEAPAAPPGALGGGGGASGAVARALAWSPLRTRPGSVLGTPAYMPPEQARGEVHRIGPATDVYALGALLLQILTGEPPDVGPRFWEPSVAVQEQLRKLDDDPDVPPDLAAICRRAMAADPALRHPDAAALAAEITAFLDGAQRREQALAALAEARARAGALDSLRARAAATRDEARRALAQVRPSDPVERKARGWDLEDEAERLERELALGEAEWIQLMHGALAKDPALPEAHAALADHYRGKLAEAELAGRAAEAVRFEVLLRAHDDGRHAAFLRGDGALTLVTDPPGAEVIAQRYVLRQRRLALDAPRALGATPLMDVPLPFGSYLLTLRAPGRAEVRYPVAIERGGRWDGRAPGGTGPFPIALPPSGEIGDDEVYVPAGWASIGGDPEATDSLPRRRVWVDGFCMQRFPVTNERLLGWLNEMVESGIPDEELGFVPGKPGLIQTASTLPALGRDASGRFVLAKSFAKAGPDAPPQLDWPAPVDWYLAVACARFATLRTGKPWRLPNELEREKAARGADGRLFVWGNHADPAFACVVESQSGERLPHPVTSHPSDESPYGIRGLSGNLRDHCANVWRHDGPRVEGDRLVLEQAPPEDDDFRAIKGGAWASSVVHSRAAARFAARPGVQWLFVGFRLVRSWP